MTYTFKVRSRRLEELSRTLDGIEEAVLKHTSNRDLAGEMRLVAEEGLTNVVRHAYGPDNDGEIEALLGLDEHEVRFEVRDSGPPFNPLDHPDPDLDGSIEDRPEGGLGVYLIRSLTDVQAYHREEGMNILRLVKRRGV